MRDLLLYLLTQAIGILCWIWYLARVEQINRYPLSFRGPVCFFFFILGLLGPMMVGINLLVDEPQPEPLHVWSIAVFSFLCWTLTSVVMIWKSDGFSAENRQLAARAFKEQLSSQFGGEQQGSASRSSTGKPEIERPDEDSPGS